MSKERAPLKTKSTNEASNAENSPHDATKKKKSATAESTDLKRKSSPKGKKRTVVPLPPGWSVARHPKFPEQNNPRLCINLRGEMCKISEKTLQTMKPIQQKGRRDAIKMRFVDAQGRHSIISFFLAEVMAATFYEGYDINKHYIFYRDGEDTNCAWENLVVCDLPTYQTLMIARLEKANPGSKFAVIKNMPNGMTFSRYLVSNDGRVYSLTVHRFIKPRKISSAPVVMYSDRVDGEQAHKLYIDGRKVAMSTFKSHQDVDIVGDLVPEKRPKAKYRQIKSTVRKPMPSITEETKWRPVGILPWHKLSFSHYEVSDVGHVRLVHTDECIRPDYTRSGFPKVKMVCDEKKVADDQCIATLAEPHMIRVSRLVANSFIGGYSKEKGFVEHINGDIQDNRVENLKWATPLFRARNCPTWRRVVVTLVDDPDDSKEFRCMTEAERELLTPFAKERRQKKFAYGESVTREVNWDGQIRSAIIQVF
ncbi:hypothetical protein BJV82DRAFT_619646 [Fennellomyces sp. T-0311]|nr:hypothetical protein BJV82DRAFT_619646 [Fennellomyces sp. T-0311]